MCEQFILEEEGLPPSMRNLAYRERGLKLLSLIVILQIGKIVLKKL